MLAIAGYIQSLENNLSEVERYVSQPTERGIEDSRNLLDQINNDLLPSTKDACEEAFDYDPEAMDTFLDWMDTTKEKLEDFGSTVERLENCPYPWVLNVTSTGGASENNNDWLGVFNKTADAHDGKPVWRHNDRDDRFFCFWSNSVEFGGDKWMITDDVHKDKAAIVSQEEYPDEIPQTGWKFWNDSESEWQHDETLEVTDGDEQEKEEKEDEY